MAMRLYRTTRAQAVFGFAVLACAVFAPAAAFAKKKEPPPAHPPLRATLQPAFTIPAEPLGFAAPGEFYLGAREAMVSLDFLGEDRLLFTFHVPGLIRRDSHDAAVENERRIRAVVLHLPEGSIQAETVWTVHDRDRYIFPTGDNHFLFRDRDTLSVGDASLQLKPFLRFPGPVLGLEMDPARQYLVTTSEEKPDRPTHAGEVDGPETARAQVTDDGPPASQQSDLILRILRRESGQVMLVSRIRDPIHLPINDHGYLDVLRGQGMTWQVNMNPFTGGHYIIGTVDSVCSPVLDFISQSEFLAVTCGSAGEPRAVALSISGRHLWATPPNIPAVWPRLVSSANGLRIAWESLLADNAVNAAAPLGSDDIKGQDVQIMDAATGKLVLRAAASPIFDIGGNVAISPSGRRVAIIMDGNIQVFELSAPPPIPEAATVQTSH